MTSRSPLASAELQLRRFLMALLTFGLLAVLVELLALGHYEDSWQFIPLIMIVLGMANVGWYLAGGGARSLRVFRVLMGTFILVGGLGVVLHYRGNVEFQTEIDPNLTGWALFFKVLHAKVPPALAPGAMAQLGLLGLIYAFRHPALGPAGSTDVPDHE
jgi:hypothetical protein